MGKGSKKEEETTTKQATEKPVQPEQFRAHE